VRGAGWSESKGGVVSIQAVAWALDQELPAGPKLVLISIANHANHVDGYCWLNAETIAHEASCSTRSVYRTVGALTRNGYIRKARRKGDDGKYRATDYWITFIREEKPWNWYGAEADGDEPQDIDDPCATVADGEIDENPPPEPVDKPPESHGPCAIGVTANNIAEPSKSNPKKDAREGALSVPRGYRPPPQAPDLQGAVVADRQAKQIFVFVGTRAWDAWCAHKFRATGVRWTLSRWTNVDGKPREGWWFPSLFPPAAATGPPDLMTEQDHADVGRL
jgi:hypothetical protein